jgi:hypothetical protein
MTEVLNKTSAPT